MVEGLTVTQQCKYDIVLLVLLPEDMDYLNVQDDPFHQHPHEHHMVEVLADNSSCCTQLPTLKDMNRHESTCLYTTRHSRKC